MSWPSRFGTLGEKVFGKDDPFNEPKGEGKALLLFSSDEMPPTKHPLNKQYYTSKKRFREVTKAFGAEEVGTAYENGYNPEKDQEKALKRTIENIKKEMRDRYYGR